MRFPSVVATELTKLRRSKVTWMTFAAYAFMALVAGFFMWMMKNPGVARSMGLIGRKADFAFGSGAADWPAFLSFIVVMGAVGGLILGSVIVAFVFGREYTEGMAKNMLALPIPRSWFVLGKLVVSAVWFALLTLWLIVAAWIAGTVLGLTGLTPGIFIAAGARLMLLALMAFCCAALVAWIAVETRGYFAPMGFAIFTLVLANVFAHTGWGAYVPWTIVGLYSGAAGPETVPGAGSVAVIVLTFLIGTGLTIRHEVYADNVQ